MLPAPTTGWQEIASRFYCADMATQPIPLDAKTQNLPGLRPKERDRSVWTDPLPGIPVLAFLPQETNFFGCGF
ncbi:hypothetical protein THS27_08150 [Thalassospira sp. MCCC 1A01428]|nr:hypothetical protein THS27_08150 [Thalassospira sp. MCCC 1A01428]